MKNVARVLLPTLLGLALGGPAAAVDFPPITDQERSLTSIPGEPNAPAAVLYRKAKLMMMGYGLGNDRSSRLTVWARVKVLAEEGKARGEVLLPHNSQAQLVSFEGRTVLPNGRALPVPTDAKFVRKVSKRQQRSVTAVAFPGVEVGAILDYRYELKIDSIYVLEPWYFADEIPVLYSEVVFGIPREIQARQWNRDPFRIGLKTETRDSSVGTELRVWAENIPSVVDDPYGPPFSDLALQMMLVPAILHDQMPQRLMDDWDSTCKLFNEWVYPKVRRKDGGVAAKARSIADSASTPRAKAEAIYRFVRDEIAALGEGAGFYPDGDWPLERMLAEKRGDDAGKALLLEAMLDAARLDARLVWAADRGYGRMDPGIANPVWFDRILVMATLDGRRVFLDPADRALSFGQLRYGYEGTPALVYDPKKPERITLPETPFDQNTRRAVVDLALDAEGRLAGTGEIVLTGHPAWERIDWKEDDQKTLEGWKEWLGERYEGFDVADIRFEELPDERKVRLNWSLKQREEDVLGDEVSLVPSRPFGPLAQPLVQPADKRRTPVIFPYGDREEVELRLRWPEGWRLESLPALTKQERPVGALVVEVDAKDAERTLVYRRRFEMRPRQLGSTQEYEGVRGLYAAVEKSDAQALALVRR